MEKNISHTAYRAKVRSQKLMARILFPPLAFTVATNFYWYHSVSIYNTSGFTEKNVEMTGTKPVQGVKQCTPVELSIIKQQLPPDDCLKYRGSPWLQRCSMSYATRCPDPVWLEKYYSTLHGMAHHANSPAKSKQPSPPPFLGIFVGCNKGFDAINAMRMGSGESSFDKNVWRNAMTDDGKIGLENDVCSQLTAPQFPLQKNPHGNNSMPVSKSISQVHCIEPMPATALALQSAASRTKYDKQGFIVTHAAMSKENGFVQFASGKVGVENKGISNKCNDDGCTNVTMYSLDTYMEKYVPNGIPINYLSIDVEGWDYEVLLGGSGSALLQVHYLEFEYNWMGPWATQSLSEAIVHLDEQFGFTCYWAGFNNTIWRITNCWLDHYDTHIWSNIACVNRNFDEVREVAQDMEELFAETLLKGDNAVKDYHHRYQTSA